MNNAPSNVGDTWAVLAGLSFDVRTGAMEAAACRRGREHRELSTAGRVGRVAEEGKSI